MIIIIIIIIDVMSLSLIIINLFIYIIYNSRSIPIRQACLGGAGCAPPPHRPPSPQRPSSRTCSLSAPRSRRPHTAASARPLRPTHGALPRTFLLLLLRGHRASPPAPAAGLSLQQPERPPPRTAQPRRGSQRPCHRTSARTRGKREPRSSSHRPQQQRRQGLRYTPPRTHSSDSSSDNAHAQHCRCCCYLLPTHTRSSRGSRRGRLCATRCRPRRSRGLASAQHACTVQSAPAGRPSRCTIICVFKKRENDMAL